MPKNGNRRANMGTRRRERDRRPSLATVREELDRMLEQMMDVHLADPGLRDEIPSGEQRILWRTSVGGRSLAVVVLPGKAPLPLTKRQEEVLRLLGHGYGNARIAELLGISKNTVKFHLKSISKRWGVTSRAAVVRRAAML